MAILRGFIRIFYINNKLKPEIFNNKKSLKTKIFFSVMAKSSNWEILTKNLVTFMGLRMKTLKHFWGSLKRVQEKSVLRGE